jgi:hypothetical protein
MKKATSSNSQDSAGVKRIDRLFLKFTAFYGQLWRSQLKSEEFIVFMKNEWFKALEQVAEQHIDEAIVYCLKHKEFPPTLPSFVDLCKTASRPRLFTKASPSTSKAKPEVAYKHLAAIKTILQMKN